MTFLTHLFADNAKLAEELADSEPLLRQSLARYFDAFKAKELALDEFRAGKPMKDVLPTLRLSLADEYAQVKASEHTEKQLMEETTAFHQEHNSEELTKLNLTMNHAASQERYVYHLMRHLYDLLQQQAKEVTLLETNPENKQLQESLAQLIDEEKNITTELHHIEQIHNFYKHLALGERRKHELETQEQTISEETYERMMDYQIVENGQMQPINQNAVTWLTAHCFNKLADEVMQQVNEGTLEQHPHVMYEFVNSDLFEQYVYKELNNNSLKTMNDKTQIHLFITIFRELYNTRVEKEME